MSNLRLIFTSTLATAILGCSQAPQPPTSTPVEWDALYGKAGFKVQSTQEGDLAWVRQFGSSDFELAGGVFVDTSGVYVAGYTNGTIPGQTSSGADDALVRKYNTNGSEVWTRQFGTSGYDRAVGVSVDASGVYVVGTTDGSLPGQTSSGTGDAFVRKYDTNGNEVWTRQFGTSGYDTASGISSDASGIYVIGTTDGSLPGQSNSGLIDAFVRKYDTNGNEVWTRQFGTSSFDEAVKISIYASGIYITGRTDGSLPGQSNSGFIDAFVRKYDTNGNEVWTRQFGTSSSDSAIGISVDANGVYVSGNTLGTFPGQTSSGDLDAFVRKYDTNGNEVWTRQFGTSSMDQAPGVSVDASGVYVAGGTLGTFAGQTKSGIGDAFVRKYDTNGNEVWTRQFGTSSFDVAHGISVDTSGLYIAGRTDGTFAGQTSSGGFDAYVAKLKLFSMNEVSIDIKPGSFPNSINLKSNGNVPVAILSTTDFNATQVVPASVSFAGAPIIQKKNGTFQVSTEDVNGDGLLDLVAHFSTQSLQLTSADTEATIKGETSEGTQFEGKDSVRIVK